MNDSRRYLDLLDSLTEFATSVAVVCLSICGRMDLSGTQTLMCKFSILFSAPARSFRRMANSFLLQKSLHLAELELSNLEDLL